MSMNAAIDTATAVTLTNPQLATDFIKAMFSESTERPVHICMLGNEKDGRHPLRRLDTRETDSIQGFVQKWDIDERATYFAVGTLKHAGDKRDKGHIAEISFLWADVDFKDIDDTRADVERKLKALKYPPSIMVFSGNGVHAFWLLTEAILDPVETAEVDRIEADLLQLCDVVGGDSQVCEVARLMRLPGSHNSKQGAWKLAEVIHPANFNGDTKLIRYDRDDLREWLGEQSPVILRKERPRAITVGEADDDCPFKKYALEAGFKPPIDVAARLNGMMYMGNEDASIHRTQLAVSSSMLNHGHDVEEIVTILLAATKTAAGKYGKRWNWHIEAREIRKACTDWLKDSRYTPKAKPLALTIVPRESTKPQPTPAPTSGGEVIDLASAAAARAKPAPRPTGHDVSSIVADGVIELIRRAGQDSMLSEGDVWLYGEGIWYVMTPAERQWIMTMIQDGFGKLNVAPKTNLLNGAFKRLT